MTSKLLLLVCLVFTVNCQMNENISIGFDDFLTIMHEWEKNYIECDKLLIGHCRAKLHMSNYLSNVTTADAQALAMVIIASMTPKKALEFQKQFDGLLNFTSQMKSKYYKDILDLDTYEENDEKKHNQSEHQEQYLSSWLYHQSYPNKLYGSSFSADANFAYALYLADRNYSESTIDYKYKFRSLLYKLKSMINPKLLIPYISDTVLFGNDKNNSIEYLINLGTFLPTNFMYFENESKDDIWSTVNDKFFAQILTIQEDLQAKSGLIPDYLLYDLATDTINILDESIIEANDRYYFYNAFLLPLRIAQYNMKTRENDIRAIRILYNILLFFMKNYPDPYTIKVGYTITGSPLYLNHEELQPLIVVPLAAAAVQNYEKMFQTNGKTDSRFKTFNAKQIEYYKKLEQYILDPNRPKGFYQDSVCLQTILTILKR